MDLSKLIPEDVKFRKFEERYGKKKPSITTDPRELLNMKPTTTKEPEPKDKVLQRPGTLSLSSSLTTQPFNTTAKPTPVPTPKDFYTREYYQQEAEKQGILEP
mmetsp:Transcript_15850/g.13458  ORF Transcript_15850/g.13458 Transcript_15850/m.13458 type:complete len:103 (+) Transcript_15850:64-372(+)|eukprot:CAMPEP_0114584896 /NCGR_PEP_ID=MMETSP0125-20121206/8533_1 /TAXON_ID=485358 ORGANISM="Aristerostoma sp., Strain ATCC 50986" /NCGR_SAMPLE_ID=MMETSP0125 /ASSEMBLY_ACC=CAM_ASM_000245 /LENGTH=102 /DNA_ID=CAMNT_0001779619 /DNA_START=376 /DNA_END=684 /DNA_ORIENTATION=+